MIVIHILAEVSKFQSTPSQRGRQQPFFSVSFLTYFNPRPRKEGDPLKSSDVLDENDFNPRPRKEGDKIIGIRLFL